MRTWTKRLVSLALMFLFIFPVSGVSFAAPLQPQTTLKIALLAPMTGGLASLGLSAQAGAELAVSQWNAKGGVLGSTIALDVKDSSSSPSAAANAVVSDGTHYIVGDIFSSATIPESDIAEANHIVQISPSATAPWVTVNPDLSTKQYVFRAAVIDPEQGVLMAKFALRQQFQQAFLLHEDADPYSTGLANGFRAAFVTGGGSLTEAAYSSGDTDFSALVAQIKASPAQVVFLPADANVVNRLTAQARAAGVTLPFMGGDGWDWGSLDLTATEGSFFANHFSASSNRQVARSFTAQYRTSYSQDPDAIAALAYDATQLLLTAIQTAGADDPAQVKDALAGLRYNGVTGSLAFDAQHNPRKEMVVQQIHNQAVSYYTSFADPALPALTLKVALLAPVNGPLGAFGLPALESAQMALAEWNARGGVLGKTLDLLVEDSQCAQGPAITAAHKVIDQDRVGFIIGEICSRASLPVSEIAEAQGVVQISPASTSPQLTLNANGTTKEYVFRACFIDPFQAEMAARFARQQGFQKAFILHDAQNGYSTSLAAVFRSTFTGVGGGLAGEATYDTSGNWDFGAQIDAIKTSQADLVYLPDYFSLANVLVAQARSKGVTATFLGGDGWDSSSLDMQVTDGSYFTNHFALDDPRPIVQSWAQAFQGRFGQSPTAAAALTYDATNQLLTAVQAAGVADPSKVKDTLAGLHFSGVTGNMSFDGHHNPYKPVVIEQVQNGKATFVTSFSQFGTISGHVWKSDGTPITDVSLRVQAIGITPETTTQEATVQADGSYTIPGLIPGTYKLLANSGRAPGYATQYYANKLAWDLATAVTVSPASTLAKVDFRLEVPVTATVEPTAPATLTYTPAQGTSTQIAIPSQAVTTATTLSFTPASADSGSGFIFAGTAFNLEAYQGGELQQGFVFASPIQVTLHYSDPAGAADLKLYYWNPTAKAWEDALCPGYTYAHDDQAQTITVPVCHLSSFALLRPGYLSYLPLTRR